jgi:hypothetical protein
MIQVAIHSVLLCALASIAIGFLLIVKNTHSVSTLSSMPNLKRAFTVLFVALMTFLQVPILEIVLGVFFIDFSTKENEDATFHQSLLYFFATINGLLFLSYAFLLQKLYIIRIPSLTVHWASSNT